MTEVRFRYVDQNCTILCVLKALMHKQNKGFKCDFMKYLTFLGEIKDWC